MEGKGKRPSPHPVHTLTPRGRGKVIGQTHSRWARGRYTGVCHGSDWDVGRQRDIPLSFLSSEGNTSSGKRDVPPRPCLLERGGRASAFWSGCLSFMMMTRGVGFTYLFSSFLAPQGVCFSCTKLHMRRLGPLKTLWLGLLDSAPDIHTYIHALSFASQMHIDVFGEWL